MDWDHSYFTMADNNIEHIWYFLKRCQEKGWLYKGWRTMPWCTRCGTSLSQHELIDSYRDITHPSLYVRLPLAAPVIMAGVRTAAVLDVGTATLAAFIGAGGLGDPIIAGLALSDTRMILSGAVPAALLALVVDGLLGGAERWAARRWGLTRRAEAAG